MKRLVLIALLALIQPRAAFADINEILNNNGTLTASPLGLSIGSSNLGLLGDRIGPNLGTLSITLGPLLSGSLLTGGTFSSMESSYIVTVNPGLPWFGLPHGGIIFHGTFSGLIDWYPTPPYEGGKPGDYTLLGTVSGAWYTGHMASGFTFQSCSGSFNSQGAFTGTCRGSSYIYPYLNPEPDTLVLFTTGLCCIGFMVRRNRLRV